MGACLMPIYDPNIPRPPGARTAPMPDGSTAFNRPMMGRGGTTSSAGANLGTGARYVKGGYLNDQQGSRVFTPTDVIRKARAAQGLGPDGKPKPAAAGGQPAAGGGAPAQSQFNPDAAYNAAMARLGFDRDTSIAGLQQQQQYAQIDFDEQTRRLNEQLGKNRTAVTEGANDEGLFYSGQLGKRQGELTVTHERQVGDLRREKERADAEIAAAIKAIQDRYNLDEGEQRLGAVGRQVERDGEAAAAGGLAAPVGPNVAQVIGMAPKPKNRWADAYQRDGHWWYKNENGVPVRLR